MKVVSDTSPICYLVQIGYIDLLPALFSEILIPLAVSSELAHPGAGPALQTWIQSPPAWLQIVRSPQAPLFADLNRLHPGERDAISLALQAEADLILLDERKARQMAQSRGLTVSGLLGVLGLAAERGLIPIREAVDTLRRTNFRVDPRLLKLLLDRHT